MLGKCLWKMHSADSTIRSTSRQPGVQPVIDAFTRAIETLPEKKDGRRDPILEPHYKLASVIHKLVQRGKLRVGRIHACWHYFLTSYRSRTLASHCRQPITLEKCLATLSRTTGSGKRTYCGFSSV